MRSPANIDCWLTPDLRLRRWSNGSVAWPAGQHEALEIAVPQSGALRYRIGEQTLEVGPGEAIVLPAGVEHQTSCLGSTEATSLWLSEAFVAEAADSVGHRLDSSSVRPAAQMSALLDSLLREAKAPAAGSTLLADGLASALAVQALRSEGTVRRHDKDRRVARAIDRIEAEFAEPLDVAGLAKTAGLSRFHFSRRFTEVTGCTPHRFLVKRRLQAAAALLQRRERSVTEVALSVGFGDLSRFARAFRRQYGCAPSVYGAQNAYRSARIA